MTDLMKRLDEQTSLLLMLQADLLTGTSEDSEYVQTQVADNLVQANAIYELVPRPVRRRN